MKKVFFGILAVGMLVGATSCKKEYTCECKVKYGSTTDSTFVFTYDAKKSDAEDACASAETTYKIVDPNASCSLK